MKRAAAVLLLVLAGCQPPPPDSGPDLFVRYCAACHGAGGDGVEGAFPPLTGTEWVMGDKGRLIRLALRGMRGPIEVKGKRYNNAMTPHGFLSDEQVAAVLTYVRDRFGRGADAVTAAEVARIRAVDGEGSMWNASDLEGRTGIP